MTTDSTMTGNEWQQDKIFPPPPEFAAQANADDPGIYARAAEDFEGYWADWARLQPQNYQCTKFLLQSLQAFLVVAKLL